MTVIFNNRWLYNKAYLFKTDNYVTQSSFFEEMRNHIIDAIGNVIFYKNQTTNKVIVTPTNTHTDKETKQNKTKSNNPHRIAKLCYN